MERAPNTELAERINQAFTLLKKQIPDFQIVNNLEDMFNISKVQAYRYLNQAKKNNQMIPVPESSIVFTVKLPPGVVKRIRAFAGSRGMLISKVVQTALEDFLAKTDHGQRKEAG